MGRRQVKREPISQHVGVDVAASFAASPNQGHPSSSGNTEMDLDRVQPEVSLDANAISQVVQTEQDIETPQSTRKSFSDAFKDIR